MTKNNFLQDGRCTCRDTVTRVRAAFHEVELPACALHDPAGFERQRIEAAQAGPREHADRLQRVADEMQIEDARRAATAEAREAEEIHNRLMAELERNDPIAASLARLTGSRFTEAAPAAVSLNDPDLENGLRSALGITQSQTTTTGDQSDW